jgi:hypothetical protein
MLRPYVWAARLRFAKVDKIDQGGGFDGYENGAVNTELKILGLLIEDMREVSDEAGANFFYYAHPEVGTVWKPYRTAVKLENVDPYIVENKLKKISESFDVPFVGMVNYFLENNDRGPFHLLPADPHCNGKGYLLQAEVLLEYILEHIKKERNPLNRIISEADTSITIQN